MKMSSRDLFIRWVTCTVLVISATQAQKVKNLDIQNESSEEHFDEFSPLNDFYNIMQNDDTTDKKLSQFRSKPKNDLQWNELSEPSQKSIPNNEPFQDHLEESDYYIDGNAVPHIHDEKDAQHTPNSNFDSSSDVNRGNFERRPPVPPQKPLQPTSIISTRYGQIQGAYHDVPGSTGRVAVFLGIPYATPPVKSNRLSPTRAATQWKGIMKAVRMPPACPQRPPKHLERLFQHQSEDCLYLNIFVPDGLKTSSVLVIVHGESYVWGSGSVYDGRVLAHQGGVIVVTLNYRLGILGFLNPNRESHRPSVANYGLMDQLAALHWLQENIASFGGDPAQVTVMGRGHAAAALNFLIVSPAAAGAGLFKRAIMLSGSALSPWALVKDPAHYAQQTARQLKCQAAEPDQPTIEEMIACLRNRTLQQIMEVFLETPQFLSSMGPSVDGVTIHTDWQQQMAKMGKERRTPVDILLGVSEVDAVTVFTSKQLIQGFDEDHRDRLFRTYVTNNYHYHLQELVLAITAEYTDWSRPTQFPTIIRDYTAEALYDASVVAPVTAAAVNLASKDRTMFFYVLDNRPRDQNPIRPPLTELSYILGSPMGSESPVLPPANHSRNDITVSEAFINYIGNFVRTGDPNHSEKSADQDLDEKRKTYHQQLWDSFDGTFRRYLEIRPSSTRIRDHYRADQVALWTWLIPGLERLGSRHGTNSTFHRFVGGPGIFSGPTRPNSFLPPPPTTSPPPESSEIPGDALHKNSSYHMAQDASVRDRHGHSSGSFLSEDELGIPYTTALSLTGALGVTLLLLNVFVLAAFHYRKNKHQKLPPTRQPGLSPSHCGTIHSSTTLRSLACPQDWPPEYTTCFPENGAQLQMHQQLESQQQQQQRQLQQIVQEPQDQPCHLSSPVDHIQLDHTATCEQQYQLHSMQVAEIDNPHQILQHHLHQTTTATSSPHHCDDKNTGTLRKAAKIHNGSSTIKIIRKPSPPPRSSSVPPPDSDMPQSSMDHDPG